MRKHGKENDRFHGVDDGGKKDEILEEKIKVMIFYTEKRKVMIFHTQKQPYSSFENNWGRTSGRTGTTSHRDA